MYSRDALSEQAQIRSETFLETKLNFERHKSEETRNRLQEESKNLRYKIIELESVYLPKIESLNEQINKQSEKIAECTQKHLHATKGYAILLKILEKHQKMVDALREYNTKKFKLYENLKFLEKNPKYSEVVEDLPEELFSDQQLNSTIQKLKIMALTHPRRDEVEKIMEEIQEVERQKAEIGKSFDENLMKSLEHIVVSIGDKKDKEALEHQLEDNLVKKERLYSDVRQITEEIKRQNEIYIEQLEKVSKSSKLFEELKSEYGSHQSQISEASKTITSYHNEIQNADSLMLELKPRIESTNHEIKNLKYDLTKKENYILYLQSKLTAKMAQKSKKRSPIKFLKKPKSSKKPKPPSKSPIRISKSPLRMSKSRSINEVTSIQLPKKLKKKLKPSKIFEIPSLKLSELTPELRIPQKASILSTPDTLTTTPTTVPSQNKKLNLQHKIYMRYF